VLYLPYLFRKQLASFLRCIMSPVAWLALPYFALYYVTCGLTGSAIFCAVLCQLWLDWLCHIFPHYLIKGTILVKTLLNMKCNFFYFLYDLSETFLLLRTIKQDINVHTSSLKHPLFLSDFNRTWIFSTQLRKILKYQISRKSVQWEPRNFLLTDRQIRLWRRNSRFS
jgi:hypothetical protein